MMAVSAAENMFNQELLNMTTWIAECCVPRNISFLEKVREIYQFITNSVADHITSQYHVNL